MALFEGKCTIIALHSQLADLRVIWMANHIMSCKRTAML